MVTSRAMSQSNDDNVNKLLLKCIDFRSQIASISGECLLKLAEEEEKIRRSLYRKYVDARKQKKDYYIEIELYIEKTSQPCKDPIYFKCNPKWTMRTTKQKILQDTLIDVPLDQLLVVCQQKIAKDWHTLEQCGVSHDNDMLYVYVAETNITKNLRSKSTAHSVLLEEEDAVADQFPWSDFDYRYVDKLPESSNVLKISEIKTSSNANDNIPQNPAPRGADFTEQTFLFPVPAAMATEEDDSVSIAVQVEDEDSPTGDDQERASRPSTSYGREPRRPMQTTPQVALSRTLEGWKCEFCTYINEPTRPGCKMCSSPRPSGYKLPENYIPTLDEQERLKKEKLSDEMILKMQEETKRNQEIDRQRNYRDYVNAHQRNLLENDEVVECSICMSEADPGEAVRLAECLHAFCKDCLSMHISLSDAIPVKCPFVDDYYNCTSNILEREIRSLLTDEKFQDYLRKGLNAAESHLKNTFHCKTADCLGWCEFDDGVNNFKCPVCDHVNCLTCKAIHENMDCKEYQNLLFAESTNKQAKKTRNLLKKLVKKKEAMHCPDCNIIILKKEGCDWLRCSMCQLEICWVTQKPRWGPNGPGDISGGCGCRVNGVKCDPKCVNCH